MYAAGHSEVAESLSTMVETLGKDVLTEDVTTDWDPGMPCHGPLRLTSLRF